MVKCEEFYEKFRQLEQMSKQIKGYCQVDARQSILRFKQYSKFCDKYDLTPIGVIPEFTLRPLITKRNENIASIVVEQLKKRMKSDNPKFSKITTPIVKKFIREARIELQEKTKSLEKIETLKGIKTILGDFREVGNQVESNSVDLLFTDPPYSEKYLDLWNSLGEFAARVLKPNSYLVSYAPHAYLPEIIKALSKNLNYYWICCVNQTKGEARIWDKQIWVRWKPIIIFSSDKGKEHSWLNDLIKGDMGDKDAHEWAQGESEAAYFIENLTNIGDVILDPMMGSGTTIRAANKLGRAAIGIEKDPVTYAKVQLQ